MFFRPPRRSADDASLDFPEFVGLQRDLVIRRKPQNAEEGESINMDVSAGSVDVIDMPEIREFSAIYFTVYL